MDIDTDAFPDTGDVSMASSSAFDIGNWIRRTDSLADESADVVDTEDDEVEENSQRG